MRHDGGKIFWLGPSLQGLCALGLCCVPLFDLLAYEFCFVLGLVTAALTPWLGLAMAQAPGRTLRTFLRAWALAWLHLLLPLTIIAANAWRVRNCNPGDGLLWFLLLPGLSAMVGVSLGIVVARLSEPERGLSRSLLLLACSLTPLLMALWQLYAEAPIFAYDHLWGYFAGSLYDESIPLDARLWLFRGGSLVRVGALLAVAVAWERWAHLGNATVAGILLVSLAATGGYDRLVGAYSGYRGGQAAIAAALPQVVERPGLVLHLPADLEPAQVAAIADDHGFRLTQLQQRLSVQLTQPIHSYVYADAASKAALMGGHGTMVAKPWLRQIHIHGTQVPHPLVAHELAHAVAANFGSQLLRVSARYGVLVNMALIEGLAMAVAPDPETASLHGLARAMQDLNLAPPLLTILGPTGFWQQPPARAYGVAGSFVRYLLERSGPGPLKASYPRGDFAAAYGVPLTQLVNDWQSFLASQPAAVDEQRLATERFRPVAIFARPCAHEVAALEAQAARAAPAAAVALRQQICTNLGPEPAASLQLLQAMARAGDGDGARAGAATLLATPGLSTSQHLDLHLLVADVLWREARYDEARAALAGAQPLPLAEPEARQLWIRRWAMRLPPPNGGPILNYVRGDLAPLAALVWLQQQAAATPLDRTLPYLIGRLLHGGRAWDLAQTSLQAAATHPDVAIERARLRLLADCAWHLGSRPAAATAFDAWGAAVGTAAAAATVADWQARLAWTSSR